MTIVDERPVSIELPSSVTLTVTDAPEGIRGDSSNNVQKPITLETGIRCRRRSSSRPAKRSRWTRAPANTWNGRSGFRKKAQNSAICRSAATIKFLASFRQPNWRANFRAAGKILTPPVQVGCDNDAAATQTPVKEAALQFPSFMQAHQHAGGKGVPGSGRSCDVFGGKIQRRLPEILALAGAA